MSFDDDDDDGDDGDGKLVIAEGDDLDIKMEGLGEDGKVEKKQRRKHNRFNGMSEEEVMKRLLPDLIVPDLDILIVSTQTSLLDWTELNNFERLSSRKLCVSDTI